MIRIATFSTALLAVALAAAPPARAQHNHDLPEELRRIRQLYMQYNDEGALAASNEYLVTHPGDPMALEMRARSLRQLGRFEDAVKTIETVEPCNALLKLLLAECIGMNKETAAQAHAIVDEVAADDPNAIAPHITRARIYLAQGRLKEAAAEISYVRTTKPKLYEGQLLAAALAERGGIYDEALNLYLPLVGAPGDFEQTDTHHVRDAVMALANVYMRLQRYEEAIGIFDQLAAKFPTAAGVMAQRAQALGMLERTADAIAALEKAIELAPEVPDYRIRIAEFFRVVGRPADSIAQYEKVLTLAPPVPVQFAADLRLAELYLDQGDLDRARAHMTAALVVAPEHEEALPVNARIREKVGDAAGAKEAYRKSLAKNPLAFDAFYRLALLLNRSQDAAEQEEGKKLLNRYRKIEPFLLDIQRTRRELDINPRSPMLYTRLAGFLNLAGEFEQARRFGEISERMRPRDISTCIQLGYITANLGDSAAALKYFERAQNDLKKGTVPKLDEYIELLKKGEPLPLPLGELYRPAQQQVPPADPPAGGAQPVNNDGKRDGKKDGAGK